MLVFDYRQYEIKEKDSSFNTVAPETYAHVIEDKAVKVRQDIYFKTTFIVNKSTNEFIDYYYTQLELDSSVAGFEKMVSSFMKKHQIDDYSLYKNYIYLSKEMINIYI